MRFLHVRETLDKDCEKILKESAKQCTIFYDLGKKLKRKGNKCERKQTETVTFCGSMSVRIMPCHNCSGYQPSFHFLSFNTSCSHVPNTSKNDSVAGSAKNTKIIVNESDVCSAN